MCSHKRLKGEFWIEVEEELYYPCSKNKGANLICAFGFAYTDCWFSDALSQIMISYKAEYITKKEFIIINIYSSYDGMENWHSQ